MTPLRRDGGRGCSRDGRLVEAPTLEAALEGAQMITLATKSSSPVLRAEHVRPQRAQIEVREHDVEPTRERSVGEHPRSHPLVDGLGDGEVQRREGAHAVPLRQRCLERAQPLDDAVDAGRERRTEDILDRHRCTTLRPWRPRSRA